ncbi:uncharacterized protein DFL_009768 [Arthrobotrys flagrans]|uniref:F-box domain-containing protein n=1 Tax=Arthrobotrys flagrans TaxID=97331 RepID=A0A436ZSL1_ARTFL|nr:hypothetical protein DFL_009768 [Arthrobotrys flagrans]
MAPTKNIFQFPELLEAVLLQVPPVIVHTTCRLVCKGWKDIIETTPALNHYTKTGLWLPDKIHKDLNVKQPLPEAYNAFTPMALDVLQLYWRKLEALTVKALEYDYIREEDASEENPVPTPSRLPVVKNIGSLLKTFQSVVRHVQLLRPGFTYIHFKKFTKNWDARIYNSNGEVQAVKIEIPENNTNPLLEIMAQMGLSVWNATKSDAYDYNPDGIVPRHENGEVKAYILIIVDYKLNSAELMMQEAERKHKQELQRKEHRKMAKDAIRARSQALVQDGFGPLDDDTEEDNWEEKERRIHDEYEKAQGTKVFKELLRFGDYAPHRPVLVIRGTNYGFT